VAGVAASRIGPHATGSHPEWGEVLNQRSRALRAWAFVIF